MSRTWCVWSSSSNNGRSNLAHGLRTHTWGFRKSPAAGQPTAGDYLVFGQQFSGGSVRGSASGWVNGTANLVVAQITSDLFIGRSAHWPDEVADHTIHYLYRFGFTAIGELRQEWLDGTHSLPKPISDGLRNCAITSTPALVDADVTQLLAALGSSVGSDGRVDLSGTAGQVNVEGLEPIPGRSGSDRQGRSSDPLLNKAVELHAEDLAIQHMHEHHGWPLEQIEKLGKPFDLVCKNTAGDERHVEVKGTTGAGGEVHYTPNEVAHFRTCPHGADLIVVRDIYISGGSNPYHATGGTLLHLEGYKAPQSDLQAVQWVGRVSGWDGP